MIRQKSEQQKARAVFARASSLQIPELLSPHRRIYGEHSGSRPGYITKAMLSSSRWKTSSVLPIIPTRLTA
jgi:hypothetical protein